MTDSKFKLLLVEDSAADARIFQEMLRYGSYGLTHVTRLEEAVTALSEVSFQVVLLDLGLPDSQGLESLSRLLDVAPQLPIVVLTGLDDDETGLQAVRRGAQDYLVKGRLDRDLLLRTIRYAMERRQAAETLISNIEERYAKISSTARDAIIIMDHTGGISMWNNAAERIFGYSQKEALGQNLHTLIVPNRYYSKFMMGYGKFLKTGQGELVGKTLEMTALHKDGQEFPVELSISALREQGHWHAMSIIRDVSERKYAERLTRLSEQMTSVGRMAQTIAQEVSQPLTQVAEGLKDLKENYGRVAPGSGLFRKIKAVEKDVGRVCHLSRELLSFSRVETLYIVDLDIHKLLDSTLVLLRPKLGNITLQRDCPPYARVAGDSAKLEQVFYHLLANAAEAMPDGGTITLTTSVEGSQVEVVIEDSGPGIPEEIRGRVFDPYFTTKQEQEGTGLGLSICHRAVHLHSGTLEIGSSSNGNGARITVRLPVAKLDNSLELREVDSVDSRNSTIHLDQIFSALSNPLRRRLVTLLGSQENMRLMEMVNQVGASDHTNVLFHLRFLKKAELVGQDKEKNYALTAAGRNVHHTLEMLKNQLAIT